MTVIEDPITQAELDQAWETWDRADSLYPWTPGSYDDIAAAAQALKDSLELYEDARDGGWDRSPSLSLLLEQVALDIPGQVADLGIAIDGIEDKAASYTATRRAA